MSANVGASIKVSIGGLGGQRIQMPPAALPQEFPTISDGSVSSPIRSLVLHAPRRYEKAVPPAFAGKFVTASL
jgi:hypothetical protein